MGIKIFSRSEMDIETLQRDINNWIEVNENLTIMNILQSQSNDWLTITILYTDYDPSDED